MSLTDFLLARIAEDEDLIRLDIKAHEAFTLDPDRMLAECEAKRRIVNIARYAPEDSGGWGFRRITRELASVYADHPDYRDEWRP